MEVVTVDRDVDRQDGGISTADGGEEVTMDEEIGRREGVGKSDLFDEKVCSGYQSIVCSVVNRWEVHSGVVMLDGRVAGDNRGEDNVVVDVCKRELMICNK